MQVARRYVAIDEPGDVRREPDGRWRLRAGARVRVVCAPEAYGRGTVDRVVVE